jgi:RNA 2',3'-cyclic 3'-phosphodiesterase
VYSFYVRRKSVETLRTFVALLLPDEAVRVLEREQQFLAGRAGGVKWVTPRAIHLTLAFLGATPAAAIANISTLVQETAARFQPIDFTLQGIGAFPNPRNPKVIWAGLRGCAPLFDLQGRIADGLETIGFQRDKKPFAAHITLGRVRDGSARSMVRALLEERHDTLFGVFQAVRLAFVESDLQPSGPVYTIMHESRLQQPHMKEAQYGKR